MNLFIYLKLKEINYPFFPHTPVTLLLQRPWNHELEWYFDRLSSTPSSP